VTQLDLQSIIGENLINLHR